MSREDIDTVAVLRVYALACVVPVAINKRMHVVSGRVEINRLTTELALHNESIHD